MVFVLRGDAGFVRDKEVEALRRSLQHVLLPLGLRGSEAMPPLLNDFLLCCLPGHIATEEYELEKGDDEVSAEQVRRYLMEHGVEYQIHPHATAYTTSETAEAEHVSAKEMAKVVMLTADDRLLMAVMSGDEIVDMEKARTALGANSVRLANEGEFSPSFPDCDKGAEPPFGSLYDIPMVVDQGLDSSRITFNAGTHTETITMALSDYLALTKPKRADLAAAR
ncbi:MAG: YbaK/EbsC family protein [Acidimicrobiia bacterium]